MRRRAARTSVQVALLVATVALSAPATAYPKSQMDDGACVGPVQNWFFDTTWASHTGAKAWFVAAVNQWNGLVDPHDNQPLMTVTHVSDTAPPAGSTKVTLVANGSMGDAAGRAGCVGSGWIRLEERLVTDQEEMQRVARHEMGHLLGMDHSGTGESPDGKVPSMATCIGAGDVIPWSISQDDIAYAHFLWSSAADRQLNANYGFEENFRFWSASGGQILLEDEGGAGAPHRLLHKTTSASDYVKTTVRIAPGLADDARYRITMQYKVDASNLTGHVRAIAYRDRIEYGLTANDCEYEDGLTNLNSWAFDDAPYHTPTYVQMLDTEPQTVTGKGSWTKVSSPWYDPANAEGYQFELRVYSHAEDGTGADRWVYLDNLRIESCVGTCT